MDQNNLSFIAAQIYGTPVKAAGTIQLDLEDTIPDGATPEYCFQIVSEILMQLLLEGIKVRYGENTKLASLSDNQKQTIAEYVRSYGYDLIVKTDHMTEAPQVEDSEAGVGVYPVGRVSKLEDFSERFYDFDRVLWHEVAFSKLRIH
jgi:hypothetical protein